MNIEQNQTPQKRTVTETGKVVSNKMDKTIVVLVSREVKHPKYKKYMTRTTKLYAHDQENNCEIGDTVMIEQIRPLSRLKRWNLIKILGK